MPTAASAPLRLVQLLALLALSAPRMGHANSIGPPQQRNFATCDNWFETCEAVFARLQSEIKQANRKAGGVPPIPNCCAQLLGDKPAAKACTVPGAPPAVFSRHKKNCLLNGTLVPRLAAAGRPSQVYGTNGPLTCFCKGHDASIPHGRERRLYYILELNDTDVRNGETAAAWDGISCERSGNYCKQCSEPKPLGLGPKELVSTLAWRCNFEEAYGWCAGFVIEPTGKCGYLKSNVSVRVPRRGWTTYVLQPTPPPHALIFAPGS